MSLAGLLEDDSSPAAQFMAEELPQHQAVLRAYRDRWLEGTPAAMESPERSLPLPNKRNRDTAMVLRLRAAFTNASIASDPLETAVVSMAGSPYPFSSLVGRVGEQLLDEMRRVVDMYRTYDRRRPMLLQPEAEQHLGRICYAASWIEDVHRTGAAPARSPLDGARRGLRLSHLLTGVPDEAVAYLGEQVRVAQETLSEFRARTTPQNFTFRPWFVGAGLAGGAATDWIATGVLYQLKDFVRSEQSMNREQVRELIGTVLLDFDDAFDLEGAGWYVSRIGHVGQLMAWDLDDLLAMLGARRSLTELRNRFRQVLKSSRTTAS